MLISLNRSLDYLRRMYLVSLTVLVENLARLDPQLIFFSAVIFFINKDYFQQISLFSTFFYIFQLKNITHLL